MSGSSPDRSSAERLAAAKLWVISLDSGAGCLNMPYLSTALFALVPVATDQVVAVSVDRHWRLYVNPTWLAATAVPEVGRELVHLTWHLLADHSERAADMNVTRHTAPAWRTATDASVSEIVPGWRPPDGTPQMLGLRSGASAEEHFAILSGLPVDEDRQEPDASSSALPDGTPDPGCGSGCDGVTAPYELPPGDPAAPTLTRQAADAVRQQVAIAWREHRAGRGSIPGEWGRWVDQTLDPVVPWQHVLNAAVRRGIGWASGHTDYTYTRISRRQAVSRNVVLPALRRPTPAVAVVVDTSGSIDDGLLAQALGEVDAVLATLAVPDSSVTVLAVDAAVHTVDKVRSSRSVELVGGGGTDMAIGIDAALATRPAPQVIIVLTDGYTPWPDVPVHVPVVAAVLGRHRSELPETPNWVERVEVVPQ